jgi:hypothetical protein
LELSKDKQKNTNSKENERISNIAEILSLMEEMHKNKEWILQQIKKNSLKIPIKQSMNSFQILSACPDNFLTQILGVLKGRDIDDFEQILSLTKTYHWFFCDIVAGSNPTIPTKDQVRKVIVLNELIARTEIFSKKDPDTTVILPTGDGYAIGFSDSPEKPLLLAIQLHKSLFKYNESKRGKDKLFIRVGIDMGPVYFIKDLAGRDNVWGPGIILTRRVMDLGGDMSILASARIAEDIRNLSPEYKAILHPIGDYTIKHGETLQLYNIYGEGFGNKIALRKSKILKPKAPEEALRGTSAFAFDGIEITLDVVNPKTMLTHHTWLWNISNISKEQKSQIFYYLDGDIAKDFPDMNVSVKDEDGNEQNIISLSENKPTHKEFNVQLTKPIKPGQKNRVLKLEYDWEEPERNFFYKLATDCKKFKYYFTIPKGVEVRNRVLKVDTEMGYKWHASPPPTIKYLPDKTVIEWEGTNLKAHDAYKFEW